MTVFVYFLLFWVSLQEHLTWSLPAPPIHDPRAPLQLPSLASWSSTHPGLVLVPGAASGGLVPQYEPSVAAARANHLALYAAALDNDLSGADQGDDDISPSTQITRHFSQLHQVASEEAANHLWPDQLTYAGLKDPKGFKAAENLWPTKLTYDGLNDPTGAKAFTSSAPVHFNTSVYSSDNIPLGLTLHSSDNIPLGLSLPADRTFIAPASTYYLGQAPSIRFPASTSPFLPYPPNPKLYISGTGPLPSLAFFTPAALGHKTQLKDGPQ